MRAQESRQIGRVAAIVLLALTLTACSNLSQREQRALTGGAIGAGTGAVAGAFAGAPLTGAAIGGAVGTAAGALLERDPID